MFCEGLIRRRADDNQQRFSPFLQITLRTIIFCGIRICNADAYLLFSLQIVKLFLCAESLLTREILFNFFRVMNFVANVDDQIFAVLEVLLSVHLLHHLHQ